MNKIIFASIIFLFAFTSFTFTQEVYPESDECIVYVKDMLPLKNVKIVEVGDSTFTVTKSGVMKHINVDDLVRIKFKRTGFWTGAAIGGLGTLGSFSLIGVASGGEAFGWGFIIGAALALPAGLVGGIIGEFAAQDVILELGGLQREVKVKLLNLTLKKS